MKFVPAICILLAFIVSVALLRTGAEIFGWMMMTLVAGAAAFLAWRNRASIRVWWHRKLGEWSSDSKQLGLWLKLAFTQNKTPHATATMAHQQQFLAGRIMSPLNLFPIAIVAVLALPLVGGVQEWRINNVKRERDAPCSDRELTRNDRGNYRTSRAPCAALAETALSARAWRNRAIAAESAHVRDVASARLEGQESLQREIARRQRAEASSARQRRRDNEALTSAIGGRAPDLERSLCELAGREPCSTTGADAGASPPAAPVSVPSGTGDASDEGTADSTS